VSDEKGRFGKLFARWFGAGDFVYLEMIVLAAGVGVLGAAGNLGFRALIRFFDTIFTGYEWRALGIDHGGLWVLLIPAILASGAATLLVFNYFFPGEVFGYGFPNFLEQVNLGNARIKRRWIVVKAVSAAMSLGSGWSVGREGPIAQIGGAIGSAVAQLRGLGPERVKVLVAAGAGAGIATTFNAPIGGFMFAQEIVLLGQTEIANVTLLIVATVSAVVTSRAITGNVAVFDVPQFILRSYWEMATYGLMGLLLGLLSVAFIRFFHATADRFGRWNVPQWRKLGLGALIVGGIAILLPQNLSDGYPVINATMSGGFDMKILLALTVAKFVASSVSLGSGAPGGVFGPIFFIGTMAGGSTQRIFSHLLPGLTGPRGSYALVGLGAFLAGTTHAPLTALFLLFEMTQNYSVALPAMIATIGAAAVARAIESESIDTFRLAREGKTLHIGQERQALRQIPVGAVMETQVTVAPDNAPLTEVLQIAGDTEQSTIPVVSTEGTLSGLIITRNLLALLSRGDELSPLVNAYDLSNRTPATVRPTDNLDQASQVMEAEALDELPVTEESAQGKLAGLVTRRQIARAVNRISVSLSTLSTRDASIYWAAGYRVTRIHVPVAADGVTIRELDARARFGITVLAMRDVENPAAGFVPIAPDQKLKTGDMVVVAGRNSDLRRFARALEMLAARPTSAAQQR